MNTAKALPLVSAFLANIFWMLALAAPSYHYQQIVMFDVVSVFIDISLWQFHAKSDCLPILSTWPGYKEGMLSRDVSLCHHTLKHIDNKSLSDVTTYFCGIQTTTAGYADVGCDKFTLLSLGTSIFLASILCALAINFVSIGMILVFFSCRPTKLVRNLIRVISGFCAILASLGLFLYVNIGGQIDNGRLASVLEVAFANGREKQTWSYSLGFGIAIIALIFQGIAAACGMFGISVDLCVDHKDNKSKRSDTATNRLIGDYWSTTAYQQQQMEGYGNAQRIHRMV